MTDKHKVFISYHHANDEGYKNKFEKMCEDVIVSKAIHDGDIDPNLKTETIRQKIRDEYLKESTVTVVLIGQETWKRKHVDWEIGSSIRKSKSNLRSGLIEILLPSYTRPEPGKYSHCTISPRLYDNVECGFAKIYNWSNDSREIKSWIHNAFQRKDKINPNNSRDSFGKNHTGSSWC